MKNFRSYLFRGLLILLPAGATFLLCWKLYQLLDKLILVYIHKLFALVRIPSNPLLDLVTLTVFIVLVGFFGGNFLGRKMVVFTNFLVNKIPFIRTVYAAIQQILESILREDKNAFSKVALIEYPRKGLYSLAFITSDTKGTVKNSLKEDLWSVFLPTTPNPTSGFLLFVPKKDTLIMDMSVDQAAKLIMSAGVIDEKQVLETQPSISIQQFKKFSWLKKKKTQ
ncbi:DUF502 domain-containing protein [Fibrobacterota bacterium]